MVFEECVTLWKKQEHIRPDMWKGAGEITMVMGVMVLVVWFQYHFFVTMYLNLLGMVFSHVFLFVFSNKPSSITTAEASLLSSELQSIL